MFGTILVPRDQASADATVVGLLSVGVELSGGGIQSLDYLGTH